ncbi:unnamed protein product [Paramecium sonneborni]|uniref:Uncharacterized protein n=1 Tax=Paramecium sonneborni TaxID=65129 RepID=A0A8S1QB80_9CILI|nr:unnamed protein product [Paramecium sonneborni]
MIVFIALVQMSYQNMIYVFDANYEKPDEWQFDINVDFNTCEGINYFGAELIEFLIISRLFLNLESHSAIKVEADFVILNSDDNVQIFLDDEPIQYKQTRYQNANLNTCGTISTSSISFIHSHNRRSGWIKIKQPYGGMIRLQLSILKCQEECIACICNYPNSCIKWNLHQYAFNQKEIGFPDGWTITPNILDITTQFCGGCEYLKFQEISYSTQLPPHQDILIRFFKGSSNPISCDYIFDKLIIQGNVYFVEILLKNYPNSILNLKIKNVSSNNYIWIRDFEIYYTQPEITFLSLNEGCQDQIGDACLNCRYGWIQDEYQQNCIPICGDRIIQGDEECDDGNLIYNDGCFQCKYQCIDSCKTCMFGICKQCQDGFVLNVNNNCDPLCGDGIVIPYSIEQCDINSNEDQSGCQNCRYISIPYCKQSYLSSCLECQEGFLILNNVCYPYCGDLKSNDDEDRNLQSYDSCIICDKGLCRLKCHDGYEFINQSCYSICGDQIITIEEECDDGNNIIFDGCFDCKYSCPENCYDQSVKVNINCKIQINVNYKQFVETDQCRNKRNVMMEIIKQLMVALIAQLNKIGYVIQQQKILQANAYLSNLPIQQLIILI